jgi:NADH-quinone oxidoreductase subunit E
MNSEQAANGRRLLAKYKPEIDTIFSRYPDKRSAMLPMLYLAQREYGWLSQDVLHEVADILELEPTEVISVAGFYTLFYKEPVGRYVIEICDDLPCALRGAEQFVEHACQKLGIRVGETTPDGLFTLHTVMCLAACDRAPMMQVNLEYHENMTDEKFDALIDELRARGGGQATDDGQGTP